MKKEPTTKIMAFSKERKEQLPGGAQVHLHLQSSPDWFSIARSNQRVRPTCFPLGALAPGTASQH